MQQPKYSPADEEKLMVEMWSPRLADDPLAFVLFAYPWGKAGTPLANFSGPRKWQRKELIRIRDHIRNNKANPDRMDVLRLAIASGRGPGKSALITWIAQWLLSTCIGATVILSANSENQLRAVTWGEMSRWCAMLINSHWFEVSATKLSPAQWLTDLVERDLKQGTRYWGCEGKLWSAENPDAYAGPHSQNGMMVLFDEASGIDDPIWPVANGYFTDPILHRYWIAFSNPRRPSGAFYECFNAKRAFWQTENIDCRDVEGTDQTVYRQIVAEYGADSYQARVEVYGQFPAQGEDQFISAETVAQAMSRKPYNDPHAPISVGVDVARFGSDKTVIAVRKGRDIIALRKFSGIDTMNTAGQVIKIMSEFSPSMVAIDEGGLGAGVVDRLLEQKYKVRGVNFGEKADAAQYGNKRAEMWGEMRDWLKTAAIPDDRELRSDLIGPTYKLNSMGQVMLERKEDMKKRGAASPDAADAIAITFAYPVAWGAQSQKIKYPSFGVV